MYKGYEIAIDVKGTWRFDNDYADTVVIFGTDNSSSSHAGNYKDNFSVLGEQDTSGINGTFSAPEKKFGINFTKRKKKFCLSLQHYNGDNSYFFLNGNL